MGEESTESPPRGILKKGQIDSTIDVFPAPEGEGSFWDGKNFSPMVARADTGGKVLDLVIKMMSERASIEQKYAKELGKWSDKWANKFKSSSEDYTSTLGDAIAGIATEGQQLATLHADIKSTIDVDIRPKIESFKKQRYSKCTKSNQQAVKVLEGAVKRWDKYKAKIAKAKDKVTQKEATVHEMRRTGATLKAIDKREGEVSTLKNAVVTRVQEIYEYRQTFVSEMKTEFDKSQEDEKARIQALGEALSAFHGVSDIPSRFEPVTKRCSELVKAISAEQDIESFSRRHGIGQPLLMPDSAGTFEVPTNFNETILAPPLGPRKTRVQPSPRANPPPEMPEIRPASPPQIEQPSQDTPEGNNEDNSSSSRTNTHGGDSNKHVAFGDGDGDDSAPAPDTEAEEGREGDGDIDGGD